MSICPVFPSGPLVPNGSCFVDSNNIDQTVAGFKKCCGPAPVAQAYNSGAHVCLIYCPLVGDGPSAKDLSDCLVSQIGSAACTVSGQLASPSDVDRASDLAKTTGLCSACLAGTTTTVQTTMATTTGSESTVSETTSDTAAENTTEGSLNTATITTAPTRTGMSRATTITASSTSTNVAAGMYQTDHIPWKIGFTMGAMLLAGAIARLLV
ncbi:hypothetical protein TrVFT333_009337 [Trichoderma virens FT-333]|nr:hypothetical protein TrVFT333_009337 [Trichoderma virens FT-333]